MKKADFERYVTQVAKPTRYLISIAPEDRLDWRPAKNMMPLGRLLGHLAEAITAIGLTASESWPDRIEPRKPPKMSPETCIQECDKNLQSTLGTVKALSEEDYYNKDLKMPWGATDKMSMMLMMMCDHLIHHKMQLFLYLKQLGFDLDTMNLYYGESEG